METELAKILGSMEGDAFVPSKVQMLVNCARVPVMDGHLESLVLSTRKDATVEEVVKGVGELPFLSVAGAAAPVGSASPDHSTP